MRTAATPAICTTVLPDEMVSRDADAEIARRRELDEAGIGRGARCADGRGQRVAGAAGDRDRAAARAHAEAVARLHPQRLRGRDRGDGESEQQKEEEAAIAHR
jgi:hypothetical protein